jgi:hypothetical protein
MLQGSPRRPFGPVASAVVAATIESRLGIKRKANGQKGAVRDGYLSTKVCCNSGDSQAFLWLIRSPPCDA